MRIGVLRDLFLQEKGMIFFFKLNFQSFLYYPKYELCLYVNMPDLGTCYQNKHHWWKEGGVDLFSMSRKGRIYFYITNQIVMTPPPPTHTDTHIP